MRKRTGRRPELFLALAVVSAGCAITQPPSAKVEVLQPKEANRRSVAVLCDTYMQDYELADRLRDSFRQECVRRGFEVKEVEYDADLIIVPSITASAADQSPAARPRVLWQRPHLFDTTSDSLRGAGLRRLESSSPASASQLVLVVSAYRRQDWFDPQFIDAPISKAWCITAAAPRHDGQEAEQLPGLVTACGKALDQLAAKD